MTDASQKQRLRTELRRARSTLAEAVRIRETQATVDCCLGLIARRAHTQVASYLACGGELDLSDLHRHLWGMGAAVLVPRVAGPGLVTWHAIRSLAETVPGAHRIPEPHASVAPVVLPPEVLLLVPGVAFSAQGDRLGQGGGYYDRILAGQPGSQASPIGIVSVGVGFTCQRCDAIPTDPHDLQVDGVILGGILVCDPWRRLKP